MAKESSRFQNINMGFAPLIEMSGNRQATVEGSAGVLLYEDTCVKISTGRMILVFHGRGLRLRCISGSCVEINGFISGMEFLC